MKSADLLGKTPQSTAPVTGGPSSGAPIHGHRPGRRALINLSVIILVILACVGGVLYYNHRHQSATQKVTGPYTYSYKTLTGYSIAGAAAGKGASFKLPPEFVTFDKRKVNTKDPSVRGFLEFYKSNKPLIAGAYVSSVPYINNQAPPAAYLKTFNDAVKTPSGQFYKAQVQQAIRFIRFRYVGYSATVSKASAFTNDNIKSSAWSFDYTITSKGQPTMQGRLVTAYGKNANYNFLVTAVTYNWTGNQDTWTQVFGSLKVDQ